MAKDFDKTLSERYGQIDYTAVRIQGFTRGDRHIVVISDVSSASGLPLEAYREALALSVERLGYDLTRSRFYEQDWYGNVRSLEIVRQHPLESSSLDPRVHGGFGEFRVQNVRLEDRSVLQSICEGEIPPSGIELAQQRAESIERLRQSGQRTSEELRERAAHYLENKQNSQNPEQDLER